MELHAALPTLNQALVIGTRVTKRTPILYSKLQDAMTALQNLAQAPLTAGTFDVCVLADVCPSAFTV